MTAVVVRAIGAALERRDLSRAEMADVFGALMDGEATPAQIGGLLVALRAKGESVEELVGAASAMRLRATPLACPRLEHSIDTCGTGGDATGTVNVSTLAAILIAAAGGVVAKHGNRAQSSRCGSADVLEALGIAVDAPAAAVEQCLAACNIGFAFAPRFHAATRQVVGPRKELGTRTIFNLLGPLTNPAGVRHQVCGVYAQAWCEPLAAALGALGLRRAAVVHGAGGIDELAVHGPTHVALWDDGTVIDGGVAHAPVEEEAAAALAAGLRGGAAAGAGDAWAAAGGAATSGLASGASSGFGDAPRSGRGGKAMAAGAGQGTPPARDASARGRAEQGTLPARDASARGRAGQGTLTVLTLTPASFGIEPVDPAGLAGGDAACNASVLRAVLADREVGRGERYEAVLVAAAMTAALGLELLESGALDLDRLPDQYLRARTVAVDGAGEQTLEAWRAASQAARGAV